MNAKSLSRQNLWSLQLFLLISCAVFLVRGFDLYTAFPESVLQVLGCPPPPILTHLALTGYIFTVLPPLVIHRLAGERPVVHWRHLGYRSCFYLFYLWSGTLAGNFLMVFAAGVTLYLLEQASISYPLARTVAGDGQAA